MAPNIQLFELDIDKESNIGKFFKGSDLVIGAIGPSADYSEKNVTWSNGREYSVC